jgi:acyl-coenzyme A synthetase/AMP-(fatty) acid ligase
MILPARFHGDLPPRLFNMARHVIGGAARSSPDKIALLVVDAADGRTLETWTFARLERGILGVAAGLGWVGLKPGDRLLIRFDNTSAYALLFFGALAAGVLPIPTSTMLTETEAAFLLDDSEAQAVALAHGIARPERPGLRVITPVDIADWISSGRGAAYAETGADDPAYLVYTSGTTSRPKGVLHAHRAAWGRRPMYRGWYDLGPDDRMLHAGAFNWTYTLGTGLTDPWANGATAVIVLGDKRPQSWPGLIRTTGATIFAAVPQVYRQILKYAGDGAADLGRLRHGLMAGEAPPPGLVEAWERATGTTLHEAIGMSEMSTFVSSSPLVPRRAGYIGKPQPGRAVRILPVEGGTEPLEPGAEGLLAVHVSDPGLMLGYWRRPEEARAVRRGDWFIGGDLALMDEDGYVAHRGRANDLMKAMGYRVAPEEVEAVIARHPDVAEVGCAEVRVREDVAVIGAFVVPRPGAQPSADAIIAFARTALAPYKCPRHVAFISALPRTANGKVKRAELPGMGREQQASDRSVHR